MIRGNTPNMEIDRNNSDVNNETCLTVSGEKQFLYNMETVARGSNEKLEPTKRPANNLCSAFDRSETGEECVSSNKKTKLSVSNELDSKEWILKSEAHLEEDASVFDMSCETNLKDTDSVHKTESMCMSTHSGEPDVIVELDFEFSSETSAIKSMEEANMKLSLQEVAEKLIDKSSLSCTQIPHNFKKGLCYSWLTNQFSCRLPPHFCKFGHDARALFKKKLKKQPSNFIIQVIVEMRQDLLFADTVTEAFNILRTRSNSERFIPFMCFFAFYVSDPNDDKYFSFWDNAATYFCTLTQNEDRADGFAYLLRIFRQIDRTRQSKIIDFIQMLKHPRFHMEISWKLLKPVLIFKIPSSLLMEAVESCNKTRVHIDEIYQEVVSRIFVRSLSTDQVETLLRFCKTLEATNRPENAKALNIRLLNKVRTLELSIDKNLYPETYMHYCETERNEKVPCEEENEDRDVDRILKNDEEKLENQAFSPPPPNCYLNSSFFIEHASVPSKFDGRPRPPKSSLRRSRTHYTPIHLCPVHKRLIAEVVGQIQNYEFSRAGENMNFFGRWKLLEAAKTIVQTILQMKITPDELLDFIEKVTLTCSSKNSADIIASIANTMMFFFVKINDWRTAYSILNLCGEKEIDLSRGKVFAANNTEERLSRFRIVLLLIEICLNNEKYEDAYYFMEHFKLFSGKPLLEPSSSNDNSIHMNIVKDFLNELKKNQSPLVFKIFTNVWEAQGHLQGVIDFAEYANEFLTLSINKKKLEGLNNYRRLASYNCLKETTIRAIVVALVRLGQSEEAKSSVQSLFQDIYKFPLIKDELVSLTLQSHWTEEEIFVVMDLLLNKLETCFTSDDAFNFRLEMFLQVAQEDALPQQANVYPEAFTGIDCSFEGAKLRMFNVLKNSAFQFLAFEESGNRFFTDCQSLKQHLQYRSKKKA